MKLHECFKNNEVRSNYPVFREFQVESNQQEVGLMQHYVVPWELMEDNAKKVTMSQTNRQFIPDWCLSFVPE